MCTYVRSKRHMSTERTTQGKFHYSCVCYFPSKLFFDFDIDIDRLHSRCSRKSLNVADKQFAERLALGIVSRQPNVHFQSGAFTYRALFDGHVSLCCWHLRWYREENHKNGAFVEVPLLGWEYAKKRSATKILVVEKCCIFDSLQPVYWGHTLSLSPVSYTHLTLPTTPYV